VTRSFSADESVLEALKNDDAPTLSNAIELFDVRARDEGYLSHEVRCMFPDLGVIVGYAATATMRARGKPTGDSRSAWAHVREVPGPRVIGRTTSIPTYCRSIGADCRRLSTRNPPPRGSVDRDRPAIVATRPRR
jgi:hypothetical protein